MVDKKMYYEDEDSLEKMSEEDAKIYTKYIDGIKIAPEISNGKPQKNRMDLGRNCPRCAGLLKIKEQTKKGNTLVYCVSCRAEFFANDFDVEDWLSDTIYKTIPDTTFNYWNEYGKYRASQKDSI